ncbi:peptidylprolyl isomerase [Devosia sp. RR2S18]|uniref:peptidylprolyl isomerase n=1 Tax=Devosia rhizosphaerae TaxID=3049774 RepID=UPI00254020FA|nr:peptidylprolyl isomerase [Devosia sp. RR2S18]WIJ23587.1 peptidylprolyl isomerase [Devosia sp. RR2S18]
MLDSLRAFAKSWPGKILGVFLLVGLAGFGINNVITGLGSNTVATVGDQEIESSTFLRAYQNQLNRIAQQLGSVPTAEEAMNFGIPSAVLQQLGQEAALTQMASDFGLGVSEAQLSQMVREDPSFQGTLGTFDPASFQQVLQMSGVTEREYFENQADAARRQQLSLTLFSQAALPEAASRLVNRYAGDQRTIDYFTLSELSIPTPPAPTEEELAAYLAERQAEFRTVETRSTQVLVLSPATLAAGRTISDEAIAAEYERTRTNLSVPERRTIQQVVLSTPEQVAAFEAGLAAGTPFETLVADAGLTATQLGTLPQSGITDRNLASAAFGLEEGTFALIPGVAGQRAVFVSAIEAGGEPALADVRDQIAEDLAMTEARNEISDILDQVEELRAAFRPLPEIAERFGLELYELDVTAGGTELAAVEGLPQEDRQRVAEAIFRAETDALTPSLPLGGSGNLFFNVSTIEPARDQTLEEAREEIAAAYTSEAVNDALLAAADDAVARLDNGEALAEVAASYNAFPQLSQPFTRFGADDGTIDTTVASAVFAGGPDHHGSAVSQSGQFVVFDVISTTPAEGALEADAQESLENELRVGLYSDFVSAMTNDLGLRINQPALQQALALNTGL